MKKPNRILKLRTKLKLSQRALAKKVGISQQHIQRLETSDTIDLGFILATNICKALGQPLGVVFPQTRRVLSKLPVGADGQGCSIEPLFCDPKTKAEIEAAGIDMDIRPWFIEMKLRGQSEAIHALLGDGEYSRLWSSLQEEHPSDPFAVFEGADGYRYAVQRKHLLAWHFKFDVGDVVKVDSNGQRIDAESEVPHETIRLWFADGTAVVELDGLEDEPDQNDLDDVGDLADIFYTLESIDEGFLHLVDSAGEPFWFRIEEVALFAAPQQLIGTYQGEPDDDSEHESDEPPAESASTRRGRSRKHLSVV